MHHYFFYLKERVEKWVIAKEGRLGEKSTIEISGGIASPSSGIQGGGGRGGEIHAVVVVVVVVVIMKTVA